MDLIMQHYMTIYSTASSPDGDYLAAGNSYGKIAVFYLTPFFEACDVKDMDENLKYPFFKFSAHNLAVYSLISTKNLIISGSNGEISAWQWKDVKNKKKKQSWHLNFPPKDGLVTHEIHSLSPSPLDESVFYAGCGDNNVYCVNVETGDIMFSLSGHTDYIHSVQAIGSQECVSASEDASVRLWDARKGGKEYCCIVPHDHKEVRRPEIGKWIGCAAVDESKNWLVCGGAPALFIWYISNRAPLQKLWKDDILHSEVHVYKKKIISGGGEPCFNLWTFDGQLNAEIPTSATHVFGININSISKQEVICISGSSHKIDVSGDFRLQNFSLIFTY